jgi:hypothetical protein
MFVNVKFKLIYAFLGEMQDHLKGEGGMRKGECRNSQKVRGVQRGDIFYHPYGLIPFHLQL